MSESLQKVIKDICSACENDAGRMMDIIRAVQKAFGHVSDATIDLVAKTVNIPRVEVESMVSFYAFLSRKPQGSIVIRLCDDIIDRMNGYSVVAEAFRKELGIDFNETTADGQITLENTPCIGMSDQAPAALINNEVITMLSTDKVKDLVRVLKETGDPEKLITRLGDGNNADLLVKSMVQNNIRKKGDIIFSQNNDLKSIALEKSLALSPVEVINEIKNARLRGRGGAGFPTGMKWEFTRAATGNEKYVLCNADEGEPGTFKDRVLLTELPNRIFEGMTLAGYAIGASKGILYLRGEYAYLYQYLFEILRERREKGLLGKDIMGKKGFDFDIRIQMGAGAYVCGEETSLISSCEGLRGDPKNRPPFPAQKGYMGKPTTVNNVETFVAALSVMNKGAGWFVELGSKGSSGTKLLSISGDCHRPGVYEVPFGITITELLREVDGEDAMALQIGGPSGQLIGRESFHKTICYDDLASGGSIMIFDRKRSILDIVSYFMDFFIEESCGYCTPCRAGNVLLKKHLERIIEGKGEPLDLSTLKELGESIKLASRCGLGQSSPNPVLTSLENFRSIYEDRVKENTSGMQPSFDIQKSLSEAKNLTGRESVIYGKGGAL